MLALAVRRRGAAEAGVRDVAGSYVPAVHRDQSEADGAGEGSVVSTVHGGQAAMKLKNHTRAHLVTTAITVGGNARSWINPRVDIDYEQGIVELSDSKGLFATLPLALTVIEWDQPRAPDRVSVEDFE